MGQNLESALIRVGLDQIQLEKSPRNFCWLLLLLHSLSMLTAVPHLSFPTCAACEISY